MLTIVNNYQKPLNIQRYFADIYVRKKVYIMKNQNLQFNDAMLANALRNELFKVSESFQMQHKSKDLSELEMISTTKDEPYVSPIFSMNEDEILAFVEEFEVNELATLSVAELNHIGKVLGVDPKILVEGTD